jgi:hypothetical protein
MYLPVRSSWAMTSPGWKMLWRMSYSSERTLRSSTMSRPTSGQMNQSVTSRSRRSQVGK